MRHMIILSLASALTATGMIHLAVPDEDQVIALIVVTTSGAIIAVGLRCVAALREDLRRHDRRAAAAVEDLGEVGDVVRDLVHAELEQVGLLQRVVRRDQMAATQPIRRTGSDSGPQRLRGLN